MSVSTVYVTSPGYSFSCNHEQGGDWNSKWASTYATGGYGTDNAFGAQVYRGGGSYDIYRRTALFDTSGIPSNATISSVIFNGYIKIISNDNVTNQIIELCPVSATGNASGYYNKDYFGSALAECNLNGVTPTDNYNQWWRPSIATSSIVKGGTTILGVRHWNDYNNYAPWGDGRGRFYFAPDNDATYKSYLTITWTTPPAVTSGSASSISASGATLGGNVTDVGGGTVVSRGVVVSVNANPVYGVDMGWSSAGSTGAYTVDASGLAGSTLYHYRAYVQTENSIQYGADQTFTTLPVVTTSAMSNVGVGNATANGQVTSAGNQITERGFVYNTSGTPTVSDTKVVVAGTTGVYNQQITAMPVGRRLYLRAYATNATGTVYGDEINFIMFSGSGGFASL